MKNLHILDCCYITPQLGDKRMTTILDRPGKHSQDDLEKSVAIDTQVIAHLGPLIEERELVIPTQVRDEIGQYLSRLGTKMQRCVDKCEHSDLDLEPVVMYKSLLHEFHRKSKRVSPQRMLSPEQTVRAEMYHDLLTRTISHGRALTEFAADVARANRDTDRYVMAIALSLAHDAPVSILSNDIGISRSLRKVQDYLATGTTQTLPRYDIRAPLVHSTGDGGRWQTPYANHFASQLRAAAKNNRSNVANAALSLFQKYKVG